MYVPNMLLKIKTLMQPERNQ